MKRLILPIITLLALVPMMRAQVSNPNNKLRMAEYAISQFYVDTVNEDKLVEAAIEAMLAKLDPHSAYSSPEEVKALNEPLQGTFSGIGVAFNVTNDTLRISSVTSGGPSERVGVLPGDRIIAVNDTVIAGVKKPQADMVRMLRGPKGSKVGIKVLRRAQNAADTIDFTITRADIPIYSVGASYMVDGSTGYLRIDRFAMDTGKEVAEALRKLRSQGMKNLILDLVDNTGGYLDASVEVLGELLPPGALTVYTEGERSPRHDNPARPSGKKPLFEDGRLVVMVNQNSASAAEITAGAIQDWDRGLVVGRRTFGKGLVQRPIPFPDGSMIRLTVAHYYTPSGRNIQRPYTLGDQESYARDILDRIDSGELMHADSVKHDDSLRTSTLRLGRTIYGGGGIEPDQFVALDTTEYTRYYRNVMAKGVLIKYAVDYADAHRKELRKRYKTDDQFVNGFNVTPEMLAELYEAAEKAGVEPDPEQAAKSEPLFAMIIKALIGRDVYDTPTYFKVYNLHDPIFLEALRLISSPDYDSHLN